MGLFGFISDCSFEALWLIENASRKAAGLDLKMEIFVASYKGDVIEPHIPAFESHQGYKDKNLFTTCYLREVYKNGSTRFIWFNDFDSAMKYFKNNQKTDKLIEITEPRFLPKRKDERFF